MTRPAGRRHCAGYVTLLLLAAVLAGYGAYGLATGHLAGLPYLIWAAMTVVTALLTRLNGALIEVNRALIDQNARLLGHAAEHENSRPA